MSAESAESNGEPMPEMCRNAKEFARKALENREKPVKASSLAKEYSCTASHMRDMLRKLRKRGVVERVGEGLYRSVPEERRESAGGNGGNATGSSNGEDAGMSEVMQRSGDAEEKREDRQQENTAEAPGSVEGNGQSAGGARSQGTATSRMSRDGEQRQLQTAGMFHGAGNSDQEASGQGQNGEGQNGQQQSGQGEMVTAEAMGASAGSAVTPGEFDPAQMERRVSRLEGAIEEMQKQMGEGPAGVEIVDVSDSGSAGDGSGGNDDLAEEVDEEVEEVSESTGIPKGAVYLLITLALGYTGWRVYRNRKKKRRKSGSKNSGQNQQSRTEDADVPLMG